VYVILIHATVRLIYFSALIIESLEVKEEAWYLCCYNSSAPVLARERTYYNKGKQA